MSKELKEIREGMRMLSHQRISMLLLLLQLCPTLCDPIDGNPPGSAVPGILQARTLEWVATAFSKRVSIRRYKQYKINQTEILRFQSSTSEMKKSLQGLNYR